jgi:hypothetical protein
MKFIMVILSALALAASAEAQTSPSINGNCNIIGNNNSSCNTFNIVPSRLSLTEELKSQLLSHMPDKSKVIHVNAVGASQADQKVDNDIIMFLKGNNYNVAFDSLTGIRMPPPDNKISFAERDGAYYLEIAPSAN